MFTGKRVPTFRAKVYVAGDLADIRRTCRKYCFEVGLCVTIVACDFMYTGGCETGVEVGLVNYPRFPSTPVEIREKAHRLATLLAQDCDQRTALVVDDQETYWISR